MKPTSGSVQYAIVHFVARNEVEVVPCSWLRGSSCKWPDLPSHKVERLIRKGCPAGSSYEEIEVVVKGIFKCYEDARKVLPISEYTSDLNASSELPQKRVRRARVYDSDDDFPPIPNSFLSKERTPPACPVSKPKDKKTKRLNDGRGVAAHRHPEKTAFVNADRTVGDLDVSQGTNLQDAASEIMFGTEDLDIETDSQVSLATGDDISVAATSPAPGMPPQGTQAKGCLIVTDATSSGYMISGSQPQALAMPNHVFQRQVLKNFNILRMAIQQLGEQISTQNPVHDAISEATQLLPRPLSTVVEVENFEQQLTREREKQLVLELTLLGGNSVKSAVRRILCHVFMDEVGQLYSWEGRKGKLRFLDLSFSGLILRALHAQKKFAKTTQYEVEATIKEWLRHAPERVKRSKGCPDAASTAALEM